MKYLIKLFPEITIKSRSLRIHQTRCLAGNLRTVLRDYDPDVRVKPDWNGIRIRSAEHLSAEGRAGLEAATARVPGVHEVIAYEGCDFESFEQLADQILPRWLPEVAGRRFCVRVHRVGKHDFSSADLERYLGHRVLQAAHDARVDLTSPEVTLSLELRHNRVMLFSRRWSGLGGFPLGTQETALALVSGGFDSPVAAKRIMTRGTKTHFLFFDLGGPEHEAGVRAAVGHLWWQYGRSQKVYLITVPFQAVVNELARAIPDSLVGVVLKRMMLRVASRMARQRGIPCLVSGDAIAQVSSQSMSNLSVVDAVTDHLVLRPLITEHKQTIVDEARAIGTAAIAERMPEYCGAVSRRPNVRARRDEVEAAEADFDWSVLEAAVGQASRIRTDQLPAEGNWPCEPDQPVVEATASDRSGPCSVIDIRHPDERDAAPLTVADREVLEIPFYELSDRAPELPSDRHYLLYCREGVMSRMQALHLADRGLTHFAVFESKRDRV